MFVFPAVFVRFSYFFVYCISFDKFSVLFLCFEQPHAGSSHPSAGHQFDLAGIQLGIDLGTFSVRKGAADGLCVEMDRVEQLQAFIVL